MCVQCVLQWFGPVPVLVGKRHGKGKTEDTGGMTSETQGLSKVMALKGELIQYGMLLAS